MCENASSQKNKNMQIQPSTASWGYQSDSLFGAGHVGTRPAIKQDHPEWRLEVHFLMFLS